MSKHTDWIIRADGTRVRPCAGCGEDPHTWCCEQAAERVRRAGLERLVSAAAARAASAR